VTDWHSQERKLVEEQVQNARKTAGSQGFCLISMPTICINTYDNFFTEAMMWRSPLRPPQAAGPARGIFRAGNDTGVPTKASE
jgi:hypothetical protein